MGKKGSKEELCSFKYTDIFNKKSPVAESLSLLMADRNNLSVQHYTI